MATDTGESSIYWGLAAKTVPNGLAEVLGCRKRKAMLAAEAAGPSAFAAWVQDEFGRDLTSDIIPAVITRIAPMYESGSPASPVDRHEAMIKVVADVFGLWATLVRGPLTSAR